MPKNLDTFIIRTFVSVAQTGSLAKAAELTGRSQPSVSQQIMRLEDIVGRKLLDRGPRGTNLTEDGEAFLSYANRILALTDEVIDRFQPSQFNGRIVLGMIEDFAFGFLTDALIDFAKIHPNLEMEVVVSDSQSIHESLISGRIDLALGDPYYLSSFTVWRETVALAWYASHDFDLNQSTLPLIMFSEPCRWRPSALEVLNKAKIRWRVAYESSSLQAIHAATQAGLGIACYLKAAMPLGTQRLSECQKIPSPPTVEIGLGIRETKQQDSVTLYLSDLIHRLLTRQ